MKKYDVTLISPPSRAINHYRPPIGLIYIGGYLRKKGLKVKIIDITLSQVVRNRNFYQNIDRQLKKIQDQTIHQFKQNPSPIVGISCYTPEYFETLKMAKLIKEVRPNTKIVVGGIHPTLYPQELLQEHQTPIDFEVIGEGEETFCQLCKHILNHKTRHGHIKGIAYLNSKGQVVTTPLRPLKNNLDDISYPDHDLVDMNYYTNASPYAIRGCFLRTAYVLATRGCPSQCTFCVAKKLKQYNGGGRYTRTRSAKNLITEINRLKSKHQIDAFYFIDDLFTLNKENVSGFCRLLIKQKTNLLWGCSSKVSTLNEQIIKHMAKAGCIQVDLGIERGSNRALKEIKKGISIDMIKKTVKLCHQYKIRVFANFLVNLPNETAKDLKDIDKLAIQLNSEVNSFNIFTPYPGTEIYDQSANKFCKKDYPILFTPHKYMYSDKYRHQLLFSRHNINLLTWVRQMSKKHNTITNNLKFHLDKKYISTIIHSSQKLNYLKQAKALFIEIINQKTG